MSHENITPDAREPSAADAHPLDAEARSGQPAPPRPAPAGQASTSATPSVRRPRRPDLAATTGAAPSVPTALPPLPASGHDGQPRLVVSGASDDGATGPVWPRDVRLLHADELVEIRLVPLPGSLDRKVVQLARSAELYAFLGEDMIGTVPGGVAEPAVYVGESGDRRGRRLATSLRRVTLSLGAMRPTQLLVVSCVGASLSWAARRHVESLVLRQVTLRYVTVNRMTGCPTAAALLNPAEQQAGAHIAQAVCAALEVAFAGRQAVCPRGGNLCDAIVRAIRQAGRAVDRQELLAMAADGRVPLTSRTPWQSLRRDLQIREPANADQTRVLSADVAGIGRLWWPADLDQMTAVDRYRRHHRPSRAS